MRDVLFLCFQSGLVKTVSKGVLRACGLARILNCAEGGDAVIISYNSWTSTLTIKCTILRGRRVTTTGSIVYARVTLPAIDISGLEINSCFIPVGAQTAFKPVNTTYAPHVSTKAHQLDGLL